MFGPLLGPKSASNLSFDALLEHVGSLLVGSSEADLEPNLTLKSAPKFAQNGFVMRDYLK